MDNSDSIQGYHFSVDVVCCNCYRVMRVYFVRQNSSIHQSKCRDFSTCLQKSHTCTRDFTASWLCSSGCWAFFPSQCFSMIILVFYVAQVVKRVSSSRRYSPISACLKVTMPVGSSFLASAVDRALTPKPYYQSVSAYSP